MWWGEEWEWWCGGRGEEGKRAGASDVLCVDEERKISRPVFCPRTGHLPLAPTCIGQARTCTCPACASARPPRAPTTIRRTFIHHPSSLGLLCSYHNHNHHNHSRTGSHYISTRLFNVPLLPVLSVCSNFAAVPSKMRTIPWLAGCIISLLTTVNANVEKAIFLAPAPIALTNVLPAPGDLHLPALSPGVNSILSTRLPVTFPTASAPHGLESWYLLRGLDEGRRYEVRICWPATVYLSLSFLSDCRACCRCSQQFVGLALFVFTSNC